MKLILRLLCLGLIAINGAASAERIKDLANIEGVRINQLVGYGVVVGLDGSGDSSSLTSQSLVTMLSQLGVQLPAGTNLSAKNAAPVSITATLPPFARPGQQIDVTVSSLGSSKSLRGGTLLLSPLKGADGQVYAIAQGNILLGGAGASANGSSAQVNQLNAGRIPAGATVEKAVPTPLGQGEFINLELTTTDFTTADRVVDAINRSVGGNAARALDGRLIQVRAPSDSTKRVAFISQVENLMVAPATASPKVIVNARTGSIVMNQSVMVDHCAVAHGNLSVVIGTDNSVSQPGALSNGQTAGTANSNVSINADKGQLVSLPKATRLSDVVKALNAVGATPQDLLSILQAMKAAGALRADLEII
ncbi:flagellar basal body P-ring protein FlgI [Leeia sp. TBRC 13508]|uniref:Flagellar P-ring protein n=1 Tax=Leeia speluncae TaxID=2884804 RepID=A0ABS8D992_9NEIS|nr:flagellar basal body P-ring protein FlgI [Leeia speluncae]MCB6184775.1 flagellar basal body P-ring protein FlgI [Leeia speluncae]